MPASEPHAQQNIKTLKYLLGVVVLMVSLAYASVPLYDLFCRVTGFGGTPIVREEGSEVILDETVKVRFIANKELKLPWSFEPMQNVVELKIGETGLAFYEAYNPTDKPIAGSATFNVAPFAIGGYFVKIDCFCFSEQILQPGEKVQMPVSFYVDPEMVEDRDAQFVKEITLSYTFYQIDLPQESDVDTTAQASAQQDETMRKL